MKRMHKVPVGLAVAVGLTLGLAAGYVAGLTIRTDNLPFFLALGAGIGLCGELLAVFVSFLARR
jgi:hypothetical protein